MIQGSVRCRRSAVAPLRGVGGMERHIDRAIGWVLALSLLPLLAILVAALSCSALAQLPDSIDKLKYSVDTNTIDPGAPAPKVFVFFDEDNTLAARNDLSFIDANICDSRSCARKAQGGSGNHKKNR